MPNRILIAVLFTTLLLGISPNGFCTAPTFEFDIAAADAGKALKRFALQAQKQVLYPAQRIRGVKTRSLRGRYTVNEGIARLLQGTGLEAVFANQQILTVVANKGANVEENPMNVQKKKLSSAVGFITALLGGAVSAEVIDPSSSHAAMLKQDQSPVLEEIQVIGTYIKGVTITDTLPVTIL
jgi:hypothetical protein